MQEKGIRYDGFCNYQRQRQMMDLFDYLVSNQDRHLGNITFTQSEWLRTREISAILKRRDLLLSGEA